MSADLYRRAARMRIQNADRRAKQLSAKLKRQKADAETRREAIARFWDNVAQDKRIARGVPQP